MGLTSYFEIGVYGGETLIAFWEKADTVPARWFPETITVVASIQR